MTAAEIARLKEIAERGCYSNEYPAAILSLITALEQSQAALQIEIEQREAWKVEGREEAEAVFEDELLAFRDDQIEALHARVAEAEKLAEALREIADQSITGEDAGTKQFRSYDKIVKLARTALREWDALPEDEEGK